MSENNTKMILNDQSQSSSVTIEDLFYKYRFQDKRNFYRILLYFPFGVLLLIARVAIGSVVLLLLALLPKTWPLKNVIFKSSCKFLGLVIQADDKHLDENSKLLVANHVSILDRLAINVLVSSKTVDSNFQINELSSYAFWKDVDSTQDADNFSDEDVQTFRKYVESTDFPLLSFAEGAITSGRVGLLKFKQLPFALNMAVQPIVIQVSISPFDNISPCVIGSNSLSDVLWLLFLPCIVFNLKVLPCMVKSPEENVQDFSKRTQKVMAAALGLYPTVFTSRDKAEFKKRLKSSDSINRTSIIAHAHSSNQYSTAPLHSSFSVGSLNTQLVPKFHTAAKTFGKSPKERMQSYKERKAVLIESARIKYLQSKAQL